MCTSIHWFRRLIELVDWRYQLGLRDYDQTNYPDYRLSIDNWLHLLYIIKQLLNISKHTFLFNQWRLKWTVGSPWGHCSLNAVSLKAVTHRPKNRRRWGLERSVTWVSGVYGEIGHVCVFFSRFNMCNRPLESLFYHSDWWRASPWRISEARKWGW